MAWDLISVNWTRQPLTSSQLLVLRNVAVLFMRRDIKSKETDFTHELLEGRLHRKSDGLFVTFAGTFFYADLGLVKGERWSVDFLIPRGSEHLTLNEHSVILSQRTLKGGQIAIQEVDRTHTTVQEVSLIE